MTFTSYEPRLVLHRKKAFACNRIPDAGGEKGAEEESGRSRSVSVDGNATEQGGMEEDGCIE